MKIKKIRVTKLFETFTHEIAFNTETGITLILGQNGLGKTIILKIIEYIFNGDFLQLEKIQFETIEIHFEDYVMWQIEKILNLKDEKEIIIKLIENEQEKHRVSVIDINRNNERLKNILRKYLPHIRRVEEDEWLDRKDDEKYTTLEIYTKYRQLLPKDLFSEFSIFPEWLSSVIEHQEIAFIETQRLLTIYNNPADDYQIRRMTFKNTVEEYSDLLSKEINTLLANSSELATKLDRTYPNRLIERLTKTSNISQQQLNTRLSDLEKKRARLQQVGLLDLEKEPSIQFIKEQDERIREVLLVYIEDSRSKLEGYDILADKIELFLKIINERFLKKKLSISKEEGFHFESLETKKTIPVNKLSSGEQHILVLYYKLLFILKKGTLLLMDEPEISLHISWQKKIIPDLQSIIKLNPMDIIIATHSPAVIGKNWNLTVELNADTK